MEFMAFIQSPAFWFDIICIAIFISFCARYVHLGFLSAFVQIIGTAASLVGAHFFATVADTPVYNIFFSKSLTLKVENLVLESGEHGLEALSQTLLGIFPESVLSLWEGSLINTSSTSLVGDTEAIAQAIMESAVAPIVTQVLFMVLFFCGFIILRVLFYLLAKALRVANYIPVLGSINRVLGWLFGTIGGLIDLYLGFCVLWVFILLSDNTMPVINTTDLANSYLFTLFQMYNPFA